MILDTDSYLFCLAGFTESREKVLDNRSKARRLSLIDHPDITSKGISLQLQLRIVVSIRLC